VLRFIPLSLAAAILLSGSVILNVPAIAAPDMTLPSSALPAPTAPLDLLPLKKALAPLAGEAAVRSQSTFRMTGSHQGVSFTFRETAVVTAKRPGRFHAELSQLSADGTLPKRLVVISNGVKVWTFRPETHQYSLTTYREFEDASNDITALGLTVGGFYLGEGHPMAQAFHSITAGNSASIQAALSSMDITLARRTASVTGHDDYIYRMALPKQGLTYRFYVDSATNLLQRVELVGTQNGVQIAFREDIIQMTALPSPARSTFQFIPPAGAIKSPQVSVDPF
jgi:outer membrane lipoprotein-sorting protein